MLSEQQQRIMGYFIEEAKDHLNTIEQGLLNLKVTLEDPEMANEIFRAAHSVKGGAAMLGLTSIQHTAHRLEDYFKVLKECALQIDQKLETMLLRVFDTLQELVEQLQGPFGLTDDKAEEAMTAVEPVFVALNQHLEQLVNRLGVKPPEDVNLAPPTTTVIQSAQTQPVSVASEESALRFIFQNDVPARLRDMLQLFKQPDSAACRQQLQAICQTLSQSGEQLDLPEWCDLMANVERAISSADNTYRTLAPIVIKEIKRSQEQVLTGNALQITASADLLNLLPPELDRLDDEAVSDDDLASLLGADDGDNGDFDLFAVQPDESAELFSFGNEGDNADSDLFDLQPTLNSTAETDFDSFFANDSQATDLSLASDQEADLSQFGSFEIANFDATDAETTDSTQVGPQVGVSELNSLADLFEGEDSDIGLTWQEEVIDEAGDATPELELGPTSDFSDLLDESGRSSQASLAEQLSDSDANNDSNPFNASPEIEADWSDLLNTSAEPAGTTAEFDFSEFDLSFDGAGETSPESSHSADSESTSVNLVDDNLLDNNLLDDNLQDDDLFSLESDADLFAAPEASPVANELQNLDEFFSGSDLDFQISEFSDSAITSAPFSATSAEAVAESDPFGSLDLESSLEIDSSPDSGTGLSLEPESDLDWGSADLFDQPLDSEAEADLGIAALDFETFTADSDADLDDLNRSDFSVDQGTTASLASAIPVEPVTDDQLDDQLDEFNLDFDLADTSADASNQGESETNLMFNDELSLEAGLEGLGFGDLGLESLDSESHLGLDMDAESLDLDSLDLGSESLGLGSDLESLDSESLDFDSFNSSFNSVDSEHELNLNLNGDMLAAQPDLNLEAFSAANPSSEADLGLGDELGFSLLSESEEQSDLGLEDDFFAMSSNDLTQTELDQTDLFAVHSEPADDSSADLDLGLDNNPFAIDMNAVDLSLTDASMADLSLEPELSSPDLSSLEEPELEGFQFDGLEGFESDSSETAADFTLDSNPMAMSELELGMNDAFAFAETDLAEAESTSAWSDDAGLTDSTNSLSADAFDLGELDSDLLDSEFGLATSESVSDLDLDFGELNDTAENSLDFGLDGLSETDLEETDELDFDAELTSAANLPFDGLSDDLSNPSDLSTDPFADLSNPLSNDLDNPFAFAESTDVDELDLDQFGLSDPMSEFGLDALELNVLEADPASLAAADDSDLLDFGMESSGGDQGIAESAEFDDLEAMLAEDSVSITDHQGQPDDDFSDFSDLEALIGDAPDLLVAPTVDPVSAIPTEPVDQPIPPQSVTQIMAADDEFGDLEALLQDADQALGSTSATRKSQTTTNRRPNRRGGIAEQNMRVSVKHLDNLNNLVGEMVVNRNTLEQAEERLRQFLDNLLYQVQQLSDVGQRMRDLYERSLLESSLLSGRRGPSLLTPMGNFGAPQPNHATGASFDALEMDRFTGFHTLSQEMIELIVRVRESASDIDFVVEETDQVTRNFRQITTQLQEGLTRSRMVPFAQTADRLPRGVRDNSLKYGKQAELLIEGRDTLIDKMIVELLYDPMTHLVNNAIAHGIETPEARIAAGKPPTGRITIRTFHQGNQTVISVSDDGAGINPETVRAKAFAKKLITATQAQEMTRLDTYDLLFHHGFSTADQVDDLRGRGVGLDVVRNNLNEIRGTISIDSTIGKGTTFTIRLPLTLSISKALCCISNRARIAFPMDGVEDMIDVPRERIQIDDQERPCIQWREELLPFQTLSDLLRYNRVLGRGSVYGGNQEEDMISIVILRSAGNYLALQVDQVLGEQEIVIKQLEGPVPKPLGVAGATVLGDGRIMPIADVLELIDLWEGRIRRESGTTSLWDMGEAQQPPEQIQKTEPTVLIVDDSITVRELLSMTFNKVGYRVEQARDGQEAWEKLRSGLPCDLVFCDIEMPRMDGLELLSRIQKDPNLSHLPIAMLTSRGADRHRQMAVQLGAKGYFTKPYLEEVLLDAANRMLKGEVMVNSANTQ